MAITPMDIKKKTFSTHRGGLDKTEVEEFIGELATEIENLRKERAHLTEKADELAKSPLALESGSGLRVYAMVDAETDTFSRHANCAVRWNRC